MVTVLIPWCDRDEVGEALARNRARLSECEIIVVNVGGDRARLADLVESCDNERVRLVHLTGVAFNKSLALNVGLHLASSETCLVLDADIHLHDYDLTEAESLLESDAFVTLKRVRSGSEAERSDKGLLRSVGNLVELAFADGRSLVVRTSTFREGGAVRSGPGVLLARKQWMERIGGYNSDLRGWGWEDVDVILRLQLLGLERIEFGAALHLSREGDAAGPERLDSELANRSTAFQRYASGDFEGTLKRDVERCFGGVSR